ncbi:retrovirus-related pol polyprotein from transposon TNT 1-94 [Tanacetum coccineum]
MACSLSHTDSEVEALVQKLIDEDKGRQNAILDLALQFENSCTAKNDLRKAYEKCNDISQESRALIDTFLKEGYDKDYELNLSMYEKAAKLEKQMDAKLAWLLKNTTTAHKKKVVEDVGEDDDFKSGTWVSATNYVTATGGTVTGYLGYIDNNLKKGKFDQVVAIVTSCSSNAFGDLTVTMKDLSGTIPGSIHYKVIGERGYENDITVSVAMILANVSVFTPKP